MKKISFLLFLAALASAPLFAQTKKVAHRSHSGSNASFRTDGAGNYGLGQEQQEAMRQHRIQKAKADSIAMRQKADSLAASSKADSLPGAAPKRSKKRSASSKVVSR